MRRIFVSLAVLAFAAASIAATPAGEDRGGHGGGNGGGHGMDMGDESGNNGHHANAPVAAGARKIKVTATSFKFKPKTITIKAAEHVAIVLTSKDVYHDFMVQGLGHVVGAKKGKASTAGGLTINIPGTYKFWCSVSGHRTAGMKGTIVVQ